MFHDWTPSLSGPCFRGAVPVACLWLSLWFWAWSLLGRCLSPLVLPLVLFRFVGVQLKKKRAPTPEPAVIQRSLFDRHPLLFRCSGTLDLCIRSIASRRALGCELRDGSDGWRSPVPRGDNTGGRGYVHPPPTIAFWARRQVPKFVTGRSVDSVRDGRSSTPRRVRRCGVISHALSRQPVLSSVSLRRLRLGVAAQASGTSHPKCFRYSRR